MDGLGVKTRTEVNFFEGGGGVLFSRQPLPQGVTLGTVAIRRCASCIDRECVVI